MSWSLPDVLVYPTGGGTGLVGIAKAYEELLALGWIRGTLPRFISVQAEGCAPIVKAWREGAETTSPWENPVTEAAGLRVPSPFAGRQMLRIIRETRGEAIAVSEAAIEENQRLLARLEGVWTAPEAAATVSALIAMKERGALAADTRIVLILTGSGLKTAAPALPPPTDLIGSDDDIATQVERALTH
jgi:threonine synthase